MREYNVEPVDFVELLDAFPGGLAAVRSSLADQFGILAGGEDAYNIWMAIEGERGEAGAADVVSELVLSRGGDRVRELVVAASAGRELYLRADDSRLVRLLFEEEDWREPEVGLYVVNYFERSRPPSVLLNADDSDIFDPEVEEAETEENYYDDEEFVEEEVDEADILKLFSGKPRRSATEEATWALERVQTPRRFLTIPAEWSEADVESFLWEQWEKLDLGFDYPLYLVEKQVSLGSTHRTGSTWWLEAREVNGSRSSSRLAKPAAAT